MSVTGKDGDRSDHILIAVGRIGECQVSTVGERDSEVLLAGRAVRWHVRQYATYIPKALERT